MILYFAYFLKYLSSIIFCYLIDRFIVKICQIILTGLSTMDWDLPEKKSVENIHFLDVDPPKFPADFYPLELFIDTLNRGVTDF